MSPEGVFFPTPNAPMGEGASVRLAIVPDSDSPLHVQLASVIREKIDTREWLEGTAIPSETELMRNFGISRGTVRHAIRTLVAEGYLRSVKGSGTFVAEGGLVRPATRRPLSFSALLGERGLDFRTKVLARSSLPATREVARQLSVAEGSPVMFMRRVRSVGGSPVVCQESWSNLLACPGLDQADFESESLFDAVERCSARRITSSTVHYLSVRAGEEHASYLGCGADDPVLALEQRISLDDGTPIEWSLTWLRPGESVVGVSLEDQLALGRAGLRQASEPRSTPERRALALRLERGALDVRRGVTELAHRYLGVPFHFGGAFSMAELVSVLYGHVMRTGKDGTPWEQRDRLVLSKAHASIALYPAMLQAGLLSQEDLDRGIFGPDAVIAKHPDRDPSRGLEVSGGSLGMGLGYAVGLTLALRRRRSAARVFCIVGDGECDEGSIWESAALAGHLGLSALTVIVDANGMQLDGPTSEVLDNGPIQRKFASFGFDVQEVSAHDVLALADALAARPHAARPLALVSRGVKGYGVSFVENDIAWHDKALDEETYRKITDELDRRGRELANER